MEPLRLSECERSVAELGLARGIASGDGLMDNSRISLGDGRDAMDRGQEIERLIGPERVGDTEGAMLVLIGLIGGFQCIRPIKKTEGKEKIVLRKFPFILWVFHDISVKLLSSLVCYGSVGAYIMR